MVYLRQLWQFRLMIGFGLFLGVLLAMAAWLVWKYGWIFNGN